MLLINVPATPCTKALLVKVPTRESERKLPLACKLLTRCLKSHLEEEIITFNNTRLTSQHYLY